MWFSVQTVLPDWSLLIGQKLVKNAKMVNLDKFLKTWSLRVPVLPVFNYNRTKISEKCQNWKIRIWHFDNFSKIVILDSFYKICQWYKDQKWGFASMWQQIRKKSLLIGNRYYIIYWTSGDSRVFFTIFCGLYELLIRIPLNCSLVVKGLWIRWEILIEAWSRRISWRYTWKKSSQIKLFELLLR